MGFDEKSFSFPVRIKDIPVISATPGSEIPEGMKQKPPYKYFSNLFNACTKAYNKKHSRRGSLFEKNFRRKHIHNRANLRQVLLCIHTNPVHHRFCMHPEEYPWSSCLSGCRAFQKMAGDMIFHITSRL
ncbi:MAG: hypothetical protein WCK34_00275 [Bacteroidota bacterium]